jgi:dTDP-4-amino-4,6-dideoxygalactose transaminase
MGKRIPLYGVEDWSSQHHLAALEAYIAKGHSCATNSVQTAVQACLELLGTRSSIVPVILPVTAPPDTLAGVLRAGAHPLLLDIDEDSLQLDPAQLRDAIATLAEEDKVPIVLFNRPFGSPVSPDLLVQVDELCTICDSRLVPHPDMVEEDLPAVFNIFDLTPICGNGAVVVHAFPKQVAQLRAVRNGPLGLGGALSEPQARNVLAHLKSYPLEVSLYKSVVCSFLEEPEAPEHLLHSKWPAPLWFRVPNARKAVAQLASYGIEAAVGLTPLYILEEVKSRYQEEPEYPVADKLQNSFVCVPTHQDVQGHEKKIIKYINEVQSE